MKIKLRSACICAALMCTIPNAFSQAKVTPKSSTVANCLVSEFKQLALSVHDPAIRIKEIFTWLNNNAKSCNVEQLVLINSNRSSWLGTSDSIKMSSVIDSMIESKVAGKPEILNQVFGNMPADRTDSAQVISSGPQMRTLPVTATHMNGQPQILQQLPYIQNYTQQQNMQSAPTAPINTQRP